MSLRLLLLALLFAPCAHASDSVVLSTEFVHVRNADPREWTSYPEVAANAAFELTFDLPDSTDYELLTLRQAGTKQTWNLFLNEQKIGSLLRDHNDLEYGVAIPPDLLQREGNRLRIETTSEHPDDIHVGMVRLFRRALPLVDATEAEELARKRGFRRPVPPMDTTVSLSMIEEQSGNPVPCRFTIIDADTGTLVFIGAESDDRLAIREGVVYSIDGSATFKLEGSRDRPRRYRVFCGRGFEYGLEETTIVVDGTQQTIEREFSLRREVSTPGLVSCDPHLHSFEFDRHGDCTLTERLISIAGEGVEVPISTAHDKHIDYQAETNRIGASRWMTPILGCEVTTNLGHFNSFPIELGSTPAEHKLRPWEQIFKNIYATPGVKICILNHGRDVHRGFTPLAPENFDLSTGTFLNGRVFRANGMELINSGAQQSDPMQLVHDWFALLRSGHQVAGVGTSDSHTVNFAIPGQGRTYVPCPDGDPSSLDTAAVVDAFLAGKTMTSFGLLTMLEQKDDQVRIRVMGPSWTKAEEVTLFVNGDAHSRIQIDGVFVSTEESEATGTRFDFELPLPIVDSDRYFLCAVATGPGITAPWWPMMPPYQPDTPEFEPFVMGISAPLWIEPEP